MPTYGGMNPFPRRFGGGPARVKIILDSLNADRGTSFDASNRLTTVYITNMAIARAISAAWGTNRRLGNLWVADRMPLDIIERWERIMALYPLPTDTEDDRRTRIEEHFARFGQATLSDRVEALLTEKLGDVFVAVEYISIANANILVPDATYPWGAVGGSPWSSTVAHILVKLQKPTGMSEGAFYEEAGKVIQLLDPILPVWTTVDWYRAGPVSVSVSGGPSAGGFYLDDDHNLDNEVFDA